MRSPAAAVERATLASRTSKYGPHHPQTDAARVAYRMARAEATIREIVDAAPPLSAAQRDRLASLLRPEAARTGQVAS